jgi:hypothetical protein
MPVALIIFLTVISLVVIILFNKRPDLKKEIVLFDGLASKWNGKIDSNENGPFFTFQYGEATVLVSNQWSKLEKPIRCSKALIEEEFASVKQVNVYFNDSSVNCEGLYPAMPSIRVGEKLFWSKFNVQSDDDAFARSLINNKIQRLLLRSHYQRPVVRVQSNKIEVVFYKLPANEKEGENLIDLLLAIHDKIREDERIARRNTL